METLETKAFNGEIVKLVKIGDQKVAVRVDGNGTHHRLTAEELFKLI